MSNQNISLSGLAKRLIADNLIEKNIIQDATESAHSKKIPLVTYLVQNNLIHADQLAQTAADEFGTPIIELSSLDPEFYPKDLVDDSLIRKHRALPLYKRGTRLFIAMSDPTNLHAVDEIKFNTGLNVETVVTADNKLNDAIESFLDQQDTTFDDMGDTDLDDLDIESGQEKEEDSDNDGDDAPIVRFVNKILLDAIKLGASDIHFEPYEKAYRIRFRTDGILKEAARPPVNLAGKLAARLKVMSRMDISERRIPQDGRIKLKLSKTRAIDFRVNTLPTLFGEKVVLRILDPDSAKLGIDALGYEDDQKTLFLNALEQPQGMILVTGPTGSGKTVSLYTGLNILNTPERNISTAEDPVEINLEGINQVNVHAKVGLDFGSALRAFLRQDPDIVMVGEIRDLETGEIAIKAAQTGHLVLSTLHTNSAPETLTRLRNMGVPSFNIATSVSLIIAQRLARRLCKHCKAPMDVPDEALLAEGFRKDEFDNLSLFKAVGCDKCSSGYKGRVGIYEVVKITDKIGRIIMEDGNAIQIADAAREEGFNDLRASGLEKARQGVTSLEEVNRVTTGH
ncbi:type IV-A pilus assembly ATPase PilB [Gammaproteobacteria bacterium 45_16_T64]|nr:type IV-A pilus assembly ATPase PilB [Gammaproteobacteria bacterium 45_16_T64]